jgi:ribosome-binding protein aMBF1 (putative translation factor)
MTKARKAERNTIVLNDQRFVLVPEDEYERLVRQVSPALPPKNRRGNYPAIAATDALIAEGLVRDRQAAGLTQRELARRAGIRVETLNRAERGVVVPDVRTLRKIERALEAVRPRRAVN